LQASVSGESASAKAGPAISETSNGSANLFGVISMISLHHCLCKLWRVELVPLSSSPRLEGHARALADAAKFC
jgi:hypothetical protein